MNIVEKYKKTMETLDRAMLVEEALRNLIAQIELHTDCMTGTIEREALDDFVEEAEKLVGPLASNTAGIFRFDLVYHLHRQRRFSEHTFGPGIRTKGLIDHITKELGEVSKSPDDLMEWIDVILLALDGAWRAGHSPEEIVMALARKQTINEKRIWPDWRTAAPDKAIEHVRVQEKKNHVEP